MSPPPSVTRRRGAVDWLRDAQSRPCRGAGGPVRDARGGQSGIRRPSGRRAYRRTGDEVAARFRRMTRGLTMAMIRVQQEDFDAAAEIERAHRRQPRHRRRGELHRPGARRSPAAQDDRRDDARALSRHDREDAAPRSRPKRCRRWPLQATSDRPPLRPAASRATASCWSPPPPRIARRRSKPAPS